MLNSVDLNSSSNPLLISLASFLLALLGRAVRDFLQVCWVSWPRLCFGLSQITPGCPITTTSELSQKCVNGFDFPVSLPPSLLSSFRPAVVSEFARSVVPYFVECDKYSQLKKWLKIQKWGISQTFSICNLLIWLKLTVIVLILITTLFSYFTSFPQVVHLEICMRKSTDNYRVTSGMLSESWAPSLQRGGGCRLPAEMASVCGDWCHWSPYRDLQQGEEHVHPWSNSQTTGKQQMSWKSIL